MPATTTCAAFPYPLNTDPIDVAGDIQNLAEAVDAHVCSLIALPVGSIIPWYDPGGAAPDGLLRLDGSTFSSSTYPELAALLGSTTLPDLTGRFLRGAGGTFPTVGQTGGSADAIVVAHTHTGSSHTHTIDHDHPSANTSSDSHNHSINHDHPNTTSTAAGSHSHTATHFAAVQSGGGSLGLADGNVWGSVFGAPMNLIQMGSSVQPSHSHAVNLANYSGSSGSDSHNHSLNLPSYSGNSGASAAATGSTGQPGGNANLPPFFNVTYLIRARA